MAPPQRRPFIDALKPWVFLATLYLQMVVVGAWHDMTNVNYHCWPLEADAENSKAYQVSDVKGVNIRWVVPPPVEIKAAEPFNVTYELELTDDFYTWAVTSLTHNIPMKPNFFRKVEHGGITGITDPTAAKNWCIHNACPASVTDATVVNCCIHHVNVHSCPLEGEGEGVVRNGLCGPWIPKKGSIFTHSQVLYGNVTTGNWTSFIKGLYTLGPNSIIAHFKVAGSHIALVANTNVLPRAVCGDSLCEDEEGETCETCPADCGRCPLKSYEIAAIAVVAALVVISMASVIGYFKWQQEKLFWDESWVILWDDIKEDNTTRGFMGSAISVQTGGSEGGGMAKSAAKRQVFTQTAFYDGRTVAVKKIKKLEFNLTKTIRREVKNCRECDHPNLCRFICGTIEVPDVAIVSEYCAKGSLNDVLLNEDVPLSYAFRFSFATDTARAMSYLHQHKIFHGHLKSSNCLVDDRWTVKVSDYGLDTYRFQEIEEGDELVDERTKKLNDIYQAPEMLNDPFAVPTAAGDIYAFAIILIEIATRNEPYGEEDLESIPSGWRPPLPDYQEGETEEYNCPCPKEYNQLIESCWEHDPSLRVTFEQVRRTINRINPEKLSPVDLMMAMMEKYSKHLEVLVGERTQDLENEKLKTDRLLYSMIPRKVADELKHGRAVGAEAFDGCTIYFSDIVGFTTLSGGSTPFEVVALLNKLYTTFDSIIDTFDVYKVETIGDAYMVVSGVPDPNGDNHAREIANMSISLVKACESFVIPHRPGELLKIRVGIHSGPVCAGVVGLKMPRYCLFGDTVNTSSRMESNGEAYKIHTSKYTYDILQKHGCFKFDFRGTIPIKGKGDMSTYWLRGRTEGNPLGPIDVGEGLPAT